MKSLSGIVAIGWHGKQNKLCSLRNLISNVHLYKNIASYKILKELSLILELLRLLTPE